MKGKGYVVTTQNRFAGLDSDSDSVEEGKSIREKKEQTESHGIGSGPGISKVAQRTVVIQPGQRLQTAREPEKATKIDVKAVRAPKKVDKNLSNHSEDTGENPTDVKYVGRKVRTGDLHKVRGSSHAKKEEMKPKHGREFDRHSGTGRGKEMKKGGAGKHNWGHEPTDFGLDTKKEGVPADNGTGLVSDASENEAQAPKTNANEEGLPRKRSSWPNELPEGSRIMDLTEYQRQLEEKKSGATPITNQGPVRVVDPSDLENEGYKKYEREETAEEKSARELRFHRMNSRTGSDDILERNYRNNNQNQHPGGNNHHSSKSITFFDFDQSLRKSRGRARWIRNRQAEEQVKATPQVGLRELDLSDNTAFPTLN